MRVLDVEVLERAHEVRVVGSWGGGIEILVLVFAYGVASLDINANSRYSRCRASYRSRVASPCRADPARRAKSNRSSQNNYSWRWTIVQQQEVIGVWIWKFRRYLIALER